MSSISVFMSRAWTKKGLQRFITHPLVHWELLPISKDRCHQLVFSCPSGRVNQNPAMSASAFTLLQRSFKNVCVTMLCTHLRKPFFTYSFTTDKKRRYWTHLCSNSVLDKLCLVSAPTQRRSAAGKYARQLPLAGRVCSVDLGWFFFL